MAAAATVERDCDLRIVFRLVRCFLSTKGAGRNSCILNDFLSHFSHRVDRQNGAPAGRAQQLNGHACGQLIQRCSVLPGTLDNVATSTRLCSSMVRNSAKYRVSLAGHVAFRDARAQTLALALGNWHVF